MIHVPAAIVLGLWFLDAIVQWRDEFGHEGGGVAFFAHIGGFIAGMVLIGFV